MKIEIGGKYKSWCVSKLITEEPYRSYLCICECGNSEIIGYESLRKPKGKSNCGCKNYFKVKRISGKDKLTGYIHNQYRYSAVRRNLAFTLTREEVYNIIKQNCFYCNQEPSNKYIDSKKLGRDTTYSGIDRIDNKVGYIVTNCVPCCQVCNYAKGTLSAQDFIKQVDLIHNNVIRKQNNVATAN